MGASVDEPFDDRPPAAKAMEWVSRITTIALTMVLPGLGGYWLDGKFNTGYLALVGFALGMATAVWQLLLLARESNERDQNYRKTHDVHWRRIQDDPTEKSPDDNSGANKKNGPEVP